MNPSTALATVLVDELVRGGVREVVLAPGSRSAPLAYALVAADAAGALRLHVRVDERSAGFLALGLARGGGAPAAVVTTSGTAVANLHPAVLESHHAGVPLVVLSADRPHELRGTGANQTTAQPGLFAGATRFEADLPAPDATPDRTRAAAWRSTVCRALAAARGTHGEGAGPVHVDVGFREPLVPDLDDGDLPERLRGRAGGAPWVDVRPRPTVAVGADGAIEHVERTVVVVGDTGSAARGAEAVAWADARGHPVVAEPFAGSAARARALPHGPLLLTATDWLDTHAPDRVVVVGRPTLARPVSALLRRPGIRVEVVASGSTWSDPAHVASTVHPWEALSAGRDGADPAHRGPWADAWHDAGRVLGDAVAARGFAWPSGLAVAAAVREALPADGLLVLGSSNPVRDLDLAWGAGGPTGVQVHANRGLAGIDGLVSTAVGVALAAGRPAHALLGDLTVLHDANGLLLGPDEPRPDLTVVVVNDDGGGIFTTLEPGEPGRSGTFERVFGTPTGTDLAALCRAHGVRHDLAGSRSELTDLVAGAPDGLRVVEVRVDRSGHRREHAALRALAAEVLGA